MWAKIIQCSKEKSMGDSKMSVLKVIKNEYSKFLLRMTEAMSYSSLVILLVQSHTNKHGPQCM
jgi:hypothetical protein